MILSFGCYAAEQHRTRILYTPSTLWAPPHNFRSALYVVDAAHLSNDRATYKRTMNSGYHCSGCLRFSKITLFIFNGRERARACTKDVVVLWGGPRTAFSSQVSLTELWGSDSALKSEWQTFYPLSHPAQPCCDFFVFSGLT